MQWRVTRNSGAPEQIVQVEPSLPFPWPISLSAPSLSLTFLSLSIPSYPFTSFSSLPFLPSLFPTPSFPCPLPSSLPYNGYGISGRVIAPPVGPGEARPPNAFLCNLQRQICKSVKSFTHVHSTHIHSLSWECCNKTFWCLIGPYPDVLIFTINGKLFLVFFAWNSGAPALGGALDFAHPAHAIATPLCTCSFYSVICRQVESQTLQYLEGNGGYLVMNTVCIGSQRSCSRTGIM